MLHAIFSLHVVILPIFYADEKVIDGKKSLSTLLHCLNPQVTNPLYFRYEYTYLPERIFLRIYICHMLIRVT